ncbi:MAG: Gfo/Idh/MocA family oxidoreductase [Candidatus Lokiarchaeota archaeon]|nr:Gfo/Idh/MocA family oxidoreductase [Candidatus Lokiarchaeota archaeon]
MKLRIGLIGPGSFGYLHLNAYKKNENCELIAVASRTEQHAKQAAEKFDIPNYYWDNDWSKMFEKDSLDAVSICSPNYLHAHMCTEAIKNDINILCEKPICISEKELEGVEKMLKEKNLIFFSSFQRRYIRLFNHIKEIINKKVLGQLTLVRYFFSHYGPYTSWIPSSQEKWFFDSKKAGGGVLMDLGVHCIDILRYLIDEFEKVEGYSYATSSKDIKDEDNCNVLFRFKNGTAGIISVSWCNEPMEQIELYGTNGTLKLDLHSTEPISVFPKKLKGNEFIQSAIEYRYKNDFFRSHLLLTNHFINCILKGKQEHPDFNDGKRATEFVLKSYSLKKH